MTNPLKHIWIPQEGSQEIFMACPTWETLLEGNRGGGKGLLPNEKVLTPTGWNKMKNLKKGSIISNPDGNNQSVIQVFRRNKQDIYKIKFSDGTKLKCDGDHLWFAKIANRIKGKTVRNYLPLNFYGSIHRTEDLYKLLIDYPNKNPLVPCPEPIVYSQRYNSKIDAYLIGLIIGDGSISGKEIRITTKDEEIANYICKMGFKKTHENSIIEYGISRNSEIADNLKIFGLQGKKSNNKFIPNRILKGTVEERLLCLQGLMDTDGYVDTDGRCSYCTVSKKLAKDVRQLILSLGGWGTITEKETFFTYKGEKKKGQLAYNIYIQFPDKKNLFQLSRKKERCIDNNYMHGRLVRTIVSIKKLKKKKKTICILVNNPNRLFITKDFVVTHNTDVLIMDYLQDVGTGLEADWRGIIFRQSFPQLEDIIAKCYKWIPQIFPTAKYNSSKHIWTFEEGEQLLLRFMNDPEDYWNYHGHEYPWCVDANTLVKMGNGYTKKIKDIEVGEFVLTLEGPKPVLNVSHSFKPSVLVSFFDDEGNTSGQQIQGKEHQLLSIFGMHNELIRGSNREFSQFLEHQFSWIDYKSLSDDYAQNIALILNSLLSRFACCDHNDEQVHRTPENAQDTFPSFYEKVIPIFCLHDKGDKESTHAFDHRTTYVHPYSKEYRLSTLNFSSELASCSFSSLNNRHLVDLTVADCSHYITELNNSQVVSSPHKRYVVNKNCGWEELTNWATPECYITMMSCNRSSNINCPRKYRSTCNPGGIGNQWVKKRFNITSPPLKSNSCVEFTDEYGQSRTYIRSRLTENKILLDADPGYRAKLMTQTQDDPIKRKAWIHGSWDIIAGGAFTDLWESDIHEIEPFTIPRSWKIFRSFDYGQAKPWAVSYIAVSNGESDSDRYFSKGTSIVIEEIYGWNGTANEGDAALSQDIAKRILQRDQAIETAFGIKVYPGPADTSIWEVKDGQSVANALGRFGVHWTRAYKGSGSRVAGLAQMRQMLGAAKRQEIENPGLYFFDTAYHHIRTLTSLQRDKKKPEDVNCFVAGTLVKMYDKQKPIEQVMVGDLVDTPIGLRKVIKAGMTGKSKVVTVHLSNGAILKGTPDHPVFVEGVGLVPLVQLSSGDEVCQRSLNTTKELNLSAEKIDIWNVIQVIVSFLMEHHYCTEQYGKIILEEYQKDLKFTTKTTINLKTRLKILNSFIRKITQDTTLKKDLKKVGICTKFLKNGENLKKVKQYLEIILKNVERILPQENLRALIVLNLLLQNILHKDSVLQNVQINSQEKSKKNVLCAEELFGQNSIIQEKHKLVVIHVSGNYEEEMVYNLTTEQAHLYYVNNCLVSNTEQEDHLYDALRYGLLKKKTSVTRKKVKI